MYRAEVLKPIEIIRQATTIGAEILRVNPPATTIARYRHMRESARPES